MLTWGGLTLFILLVLASITIQKFIWSLKVLNDDSIAGGGLEPIPTIIWKSLRFRLKATAHKKTLPK